MMMSSYSRRRIHRSRRIRTEMGWERRRRHAQPHGLVVSHSKLSAASICEVRAIHVLSEVDESLGFRLLPLVVVVAVVLVLVLTTRVRRPRLLLHQRVVRNADPGRHGCFALKWERALAD